VKTIIIKKKIKENRKLNKIKEEFARKDKNKKKKCDSLLMIILQKIKCCWLSHGDSLIM